MSPRQLIVLAVAAIAAVGALLLIRGSGGNHAQATAVRAPPIAGEQVLVLTHDVAQGAQMKAEDLAWRTFPTESISDRFVRISRQPSALNDFAGAVARRPFNQGEPLIANDVAQPGAHGFMAAVVQPGFRAVAVQIKPETAAGGFIQPNDRVDVLVTIHIDAGNNGAGEGARSQTILHNVRVLAIDDTVQTQSTGDAPQRVNSNVAVLELSEADAQVLSAAHARGDISLTLRSVAADAADAPGTSDSANHSGTVLMHNFGNVTAGGGA